jgi:hypothetical protein
MATITTLSTGTGAYNAGGSYVGGVAPVDGVDDVVIAGTFTLTADFTIAPKSINIAAGAQLKGDAFTGNADWTFGTGVESTVITVDLLTRTREAIVVDVTAVTHNIRIRLNTVNAAGSAIQLNGINAISLLPASAGRWIKLIGNVNWAGTTVTSETIRGVTRSVSRCRSLLSGTYIAGATVLTLMDDLNFQIGDTIAISAARNTGDQRSENEIRTVNAYNPGTKQVTLSAGLTNPKDLTDVRTGASVCFVARVNRQITLEHFTPTNTWSISHALLNSSNSQVGNTFDNVMIRGWAATTIGASDGNHSWWRNNIGANMSFYDSPVRCFGFGTSPGSILFNPITIGTSLYHQLSQLALVNPTSFPNNLQVNNNASAMFFVNHWVAGASNVSVNHSLDIHTGTDNLFVNCSSLMGNGVSCKVEFFRAFRILSTQGATGSIAQNGYFQNMTWWTTRSDSVLLLNNTYGTPPTNSSTYNIANRTIAPSETVKIQDSTQRRFYTNNTTVRGFTSAELAVAFPSHTGLFPTPSGSLIVNQILTGSGAALAGSDVQPIYTHQISMTSGQTYTIPIAFFAQSLASFPTSAQLRIGVIFPGTTTPVYSTQVLTTNSVWTTLTVSGTAASTGTATIVIECTFNMGSGFIYADYPTQMISSAYGWTDGLPTKGITPILSPGLINDLQTAVWSSVPGTSGSGTRGALQDGLLQESIYFEDKPR